MANFVFACGERNFVGIAAAGIALGGLFGEYLKLPGNFGNWNSRKRAMDQAEHIRILRAAVFFLSFGLFIWAGATAFGAGDQQIFCAGGDDRGIPLGGNVPYRGMSGEIENANGVRNCVSREQSFFIRGEREGLRIAATVALPRWLCGKRIQSLSGALIERDDLVAN